MRVPNKAIADMYRRECQQLADFMEEMLPDNPADMPPIKDEHGRQMSKKEIVNRTRYGWKETAKEHGWSDEEIRKME